MSDKLTQAAFTAEVMQQILNNCPPAIDPTGTILMLFIIGEAMDTTLRQGLSDIERVARLTVAETVLLSLRKYVEDAEKGRVSDFAMHGTPIGNWAKYCNGFLALSLEWANDYPDEPFFPPAHGSIRLETRFSVRRAKTENFGLLELANHQLSDLALATLYANGALRSPSSNKGYVSHEERQMHPNAYKSTPKNVLLTVMQNADQVSRKLLTKKLSINLNAASFFPMQGITPGTGLRHIEREEIEEQLASADHAIDELHLVAANCRATQEVEINIATTLSDAVVPLATHTQMEPTEVAAAATEATPAAGPSAGSSATAVDDNFVHLELTNPTAVLMDIGARSGEANDEAEQMLAKAANLDLAGPKEIARGPGISSSQVCHVQREQTSSVWLEQFKAAIDNGDNFCQLLIDIRKATMAEVATEAGMRVRTVEEAEAAAEAMANRQNRTTLEGDDGKNVEPSTLLRDLRNAKAGKYFTFRKNTRLLRWRDASEAAAGSDIPLANDQATVQAGEVWLLLDGPTKVIPVVVVGANERVGGALRPEVNHKKPILLKNAETLQLHLFGEVVSTTDTGTTYRATGRDFTRESRQLLHKLSAASGPFDLVDVASIRTQRTLQLMPAATAKLKALAKDKKMNAVWKTISPGKKAAASGTAGMRSHNVPIPDAMRTAVAAAAARAIAASTAAIHNK